MGISRRILPPGRAACQTVADPSPRLFFPQSRGTSLASFKAMHATFLQKVFITMFAGFCASGLIECWKWTIKANDSINAPSSWQHTQAAASHQ